MKNFAELVSRTSKHNTLQVRFHHTLLVADFSHCNIMMTSVAMILLMKICSP